MYEVHFHTCKVSATLHRAGCAHGRPKSIVVVPVKGTTVEEAMQDDNVLDLIEREYPVKPSPCTRS